MNQKRTEELASRNYPVLLRRDSEGDFIAEVPDLPGCLTDGKTAGEAIANLEDAKRVWIEIALDKGLDIPEPRDLDQEPSGRFLARLPKGLHRSLQQEAEQEGVSLNQCLIYVLTKGLGVRALERVTSKATNLLEATTQTAQESLKRQTAFQAHTIANTSWEPYKQLHSELRQQSMNTVLFITGPPTEGSQVQEDPRQTGGEWEEWMRKLPGGFLTHTKGSVR